MAEISNLKLKLTAMEKERIDFDETFRDSEVVYHLLYLYLTYYVSANIWHIFLNTRKQNKDCQMPFLL